MDKPGQQIARGKPFNRQKARSIKNRALFFRLTSFQNQKNEFHA
jgi:hypothetical protein